MLATVFSNSTWTHADSKTAATQKATNGSWASREKPAGADSGYLWRLNAYWRFEDAAGGVLIECESLSLSRDIPALLRPFVTGVVDGIAKESLETTLVGLRRALTRTS